MGQTKLFDVTTWVDVVELVTSIVHVYQLTSASCYHKVPSAMKHVSEI